jgi:hypothetical protein
MSFSTAHTLRVALMGVAIFSAMALLPASASTGIEPSLRPQIARSATTTGAGAPIEFGMFPADNPWNTDVSTLPVDPRNAVFLASMGLDTEIHPDFGTVWDGGPNGIPYVVVDSTQPKYPATFYYADESDPGPYAIPPDAPIEWGSDHHVLALDADNKILYELYDATFNATERRWYAGSGAIWNLNVNYYRPDGWTSADAAGLPMLPGLVRYDEVQRGEITHALRFTVSDTNDSYIFPASHRAGVDDPSLPPMGLRVRLRADYDISGFPADVQVVLRALKKYGMIVADNGGPWYISGAPDPRWNDDTLHEISRVAGRDFEVVNTSGVTGTPASTPRVTMGATYRMRAKQRMARWGRFADTWGTRWSATVNYGDRTGTKRLTLRSGKQFRLVHRYNKRGTYKAIVRITNAQGRVGVGRLKVVVRRR